MVRDSIVTNLTNFKSNFEGGKISRFEDRWNDLTGDSEILSTVTGLRINVQGDLAIGGPLRYNLDPEEFSFVKLEIENLLVKGVIVESTNEDFEHISPIFVRPKDELSYRLILNLKLLNLSVPYEHFKMDTLEKIVHLVRPNCFMAKIDIKDAYYSVKIADEDTKYLKFFFDDQLYEFLALPNGYSEGPRKFTKLLKPPLSWLRKLGVCLAAYIDDLITLNMSVQECVAHVKLICSLLDSLGFTINLEKSVFTPSQTMEFLGIIIDSRTMTLELPLKKVDAIKGFIRSMLEASQVTVRDLAKLIGKLTSSFIAVPYGKLFYRNLKVKVKALKINRGNFDGLCQLDSSSRMELEWWLSNIGMVPAPISRQSPDQMITTDASLKGWGAVFDGSSTGGSFDVLERTLHINVLEAKAVLFGLQCFCNTLTNVSILIRTDNTSVMHAINKMGSSSSKELHTQIFEIWTWAMARNIWLLATHIPGIENEEADAESRRDEFSLEWKLNEQAFGQAISSLVFKPGVDLFASRLNKQLPVFFSFRHDPEATGVNAFSITWTHLPFYAFPPFAIISKVIQKIYLDKATGILVVPDWPNQFWFATFKCMVVREYILPSSANLLYLPQNPELLHPLHANLRLRVAIVSGQD